MYLHRTPKFLQLLFPDILWRGDDQLPTIYLTFDDGPIPEATPWVLDALTAYNAKATFFMVGDNCRKYPKLFTKVREAGHSLGNHTFNHLRGWTTDDAAYLDNYFLADKALGEPGRKLFRPPHGQLRFSQYKKIRQQAKVVMWDVLPGDFDKNMTAEKCLRKSIKWTRPGSIIVFHDSVKTIKILKQVLPEYLEHFSSKGYKFAAL